MFTLVALIIGLFISMFLAKKSVLGRLEPIMFSILSLLVIITIPLIRIEVKSIIEEFKSVEQTAEQMRENEHIVESAAFQRNIADANQELALVQHWNDTQFDLWIPDEVDELEPIE